MVAKVMIGPTIRGALNYNERKVKEKKASLLSANEFPKDAGQLNFYDKLHRLQKQASLNNRTINNCVHINLDFEPSEKLSDAVMQEIAHNYMDKIGFGEQPFLVYRHTDTHHSHLHIVTTCIKQDGKRIPLYKIGEGASSIARRELEIEYGLIKADGRGRTHNEILKPAEIKKVIYSKSETKASISNVVRTVLSYYKFSSLPQLNAVLRQFNVIADRGGEGTNMWANKGLVYRLIDEAGNKEGIAIKASSIYTKPTLSVLEKKFGENQLAKQQYADSMRAAIDYAASHSDSLEVFMKQLKAQYVDVVVHKSEENRIYGISFVDNYNYCVWNGSELGKQYAAQSILERIGKVTEHQVISNELMSDYVFGIVDFKKGIENTLTQCIQQGLFIRATKDEHGKLLMHSGHLLKPFESYCKVNSKLAAYFGANGYNDKISQKLYKNWVDMYNLSSGESVKDFPFSVIREIVVGALMYTDGSGSLDYLWKAEDKKRRKRRGT